MSLNSIELTRRTRRLNRITPPPSGPRGREQRAAEGVQEAPISRYHGRHASRLNATGCGDCRIQASATIGMGCTQYLGPLTVLSLPLRLRSWSARLTLHHSLVTPTLRYVANTIMNIPGFRATGISHYRISKSQNLLYLVKFLLIL